MEIKLVTRLQWPTNHEHRGFVLSLSQLPNDLMIQVYWKQSCGFGFSVVVTTTEIRQVPKILHLCSLNQASSAYFLWRGAWIGNR